MSILGPAAQQWIGRTEEFRPYPVTDIDIAKYCHVLGISDPIHLDPQAAQAAGHRDVVAPPGYHMAIRHGLPGVIDLDELGADGASPDLTPPNSGTRRMAGETSIEFIADIMAGDVIVLTKTIVELTEKQGRSGALGFVTYALEYRDTDGDLKVRETYVRILR